MEYIFALCLFILSVIVFIHLRIARNKYAKKIFGIYRQQSKLYWIKLPIMYMLVMLSNKRKKAKQDLKAYESPQPLSTDELAIDAVYFNGSSPNGHILTTGTARRQHGLVNGFMYIRVPEYSDSLLCSPKLPDTCLYQTSEEQNNLSEYSVEGIKLRATEPLIEWRITYNGDMYVGNDSSKTIKVKLDAKFKSNLPIFSYDTDIHPLSIASGVANENWNKEYFHNLQKYHQTHYEQHGDVSGTVIIDGAIYGLKTNSVRDHSFGKLRDWKNFHRYVMHFLTLEDGTRISVGIICIPVTFSRIAVGFITNTDRNNEAIKSCDLELWRHGEQTKQPPGDYGFCFETDTKKYWVKVKMYKQPEFFIGLESECRIVEQFCTVEVNGVKGWGAAEWQYRHIM